MFFDALGLTLLQGYGQTEAAPVISCNRPKRRAEDGHRRPAAAGRTEVRIAEDGEILVRGELVMHGYWQNPAETARVLKDGWLHTGDIGHYRRGKGRIKITDRKKDMIVNDKGDNVAPQKVEGMLTLQPEIAQAMVSGRQAAVSGGPGGARSRMGDGMGRAHGAQGRSCRAAGSFPPSRTPCARRSTATNADLSVIEKVRQFALPTRPSPSRTSEMTPSMKIRRHVIKSRYQARLDGLYKS
jgi:long-chain acyl-CoA synthetase